MNEYLIRTPRCGIRELTVSDLDAEFELYNSPHMTDHIPPLSDHEREAELCRKYAEEIYACYGYGMWGVFDLNTNRLIGEAELGFMIAEDLWGRGYCKEVCRAILDHCRENFGITDVFARTYPDNIASVRVLTGLGFKEWSPCGVGDVMRIYRSPV